MSEQNRRFFAGNSLAQAIAAAANHYGIAPEELAYRLRDKRHGFLKARRPVVLEVDPEAPRREAGAAGEAAVPPATPTVAPAEPRARGRGAEGESARPQRGAGAPAPRREREERRPRRSGGSGAVEAEAWRAADEESAQAAGEAVRRLLALAGLELEGRVAVAGERLEVELTGADEPRLAELGREFLEDFEHLLPRAIHGLIGKLVRVRVEGAGLRAAREEELRALARAAAERVLAAGREELLPPLDPAERRIVHLELKEREDVATESVGDGFLKRVRVASTR